MVKIRTTRRTAGLLALSALLVMAAAAPASAAPVPVTVFVAIDQSLIRADGREVATLQVDASTLSGPLANQTIKLSTIWSTAPSPGAVKFLPAASVVLDANGHGTATLVSTRSGAATIKAAIGTTLFKGSGTVGLVAKRRSVVVFANGAGSVTTCPTPTTCGDPSGVFNPVRSALAANGFTNDDMPFYSYAGGVIDPVTYQWVPAASTCTDAGLAYTTQVGRMRSMIRRFAAANPNSDVTVVGLSQGGIVAFQLLGAQKNSLPKGSRLVRIIAFDSPVGGVPLAQLLNLETSLNLSCWGQNGTSKAASTLIATWDTTAPTQGPAQGDRATILCRVAGMLPCSTLGTNQQVLAGRPDVEVQTWGSSQDGVFDPAVCGVHGSWVSAIDSQVVTGAGGGLHPEGGLIAGNFCGLYSHIVAVANHAGDVASSVGPQQ